MSIYRKRFGLAHDPLPRDCVGKSFYDADDRYERLHRTFSYLAAEPGLGLLTGEAGAGKTAALRNPCDALPEPEYRIVYICDTSVTPAAVYRNLAAALGLKPAPTRDALWRQPDRPARVIEAELGEGPLGDLAAVEAGLGIAATDGELTGLHEHASVGSEVASMSAASRRHSAAMASGSSRISSHSRQAARRHRSTSIQAWAAGSASSSVSHGSLSSLAGKRSSTPATAAALGIKTDSRQAPSGSSRRSSR